MAWLRTMARSQARHPWWWCLSIALSCLLAAWFARGLTLRPGLGELLPDDQRSVIVARAVNARLPTQSTLAIVVEGDDPAALGAFVDAATPRLEAIGAPLVGRIDAGPGDATAFRRRYGALYLSRDELQDLHAQFKERYDFEVTKRLGLLVVDEDRPPLSEVLQRDLEKTSSDGPRHFLDAERGIAVILVRTPIAPGDVRSTEALVAEVTRRLPEPGALAVGLGGNLLTAAETYSRISSDLSHVGIKGVLAILGVVALYFFRLRPLLLMALTITVGASWTFAWARLVVGHLNSSTGFLFSIVVGNGINFGLIAMAAYLRARQRLPPAEAVEESRRATVRPTLVAAAAAAVAYGALATTGFPGFRQFGLIAGVGMLLCWLATAAVLPPLLLLTERGAPARFRDRFCPPTLPPRPVLIGALIATAASGVLAYRYLVSDPVEQDLRRIDNDAPDGPSPIKRYSHLADAVAGRQQDGIAIAVDRLEQVEPLRAILEARRDASADKPFERVVTIHDLLPEEQSAKLALISDARGILLRAHRHGWLAPADFERLSARLPSEPVTIERLPNALAQPFTERDGTRGRLVYLVPTEGRSVWDARYLRLWADAFRHTALPDGSIVEGSGRSVIFSDVVDAIALDMPRALIVAAAATLLLLGLALGRRRWLAIVAVGLGALWTLGALALIGDPIGSPLRLNFLNFVALPITLGVGADYVVNVLDRRDPMPGVVVLCSLTTTLGYGALTTSVNRAIQGFGRAAATGELLCLFVAVLVIPAWLRRRHESPSSDPRA